MNSILEDLKAFGEKVLKDFPYKKVAYSAMIDTIIPYLDEKADDTLSMIDNVMVDGVKQFVKVFLTPDQTKAIGKGLIAKGGVVVDTTETPIP